MALLHYYYSVLQIFSIEGQESCLQQIIIRFVSSIVPNNTDQLLTVRILNSGGVY